MKLGNEETTYPFAFSHSLLYIQNLMDGFPLNLILAVATGSATIFLGFLPTTTISTDFFARQVLGAALAWVVVAIFSPLVIIHYFVFFAILCLAAWRKFTDGNALGGKLWLIVASALGVSLGVVLILAVTPEAYPPGLPPLIQVLFLASVYLGGTIIGLAWFCLALTQNLSTDSGVTYGLVRRCVGLLVNLTLARGAVLIASICVPGSREHPWDVPGFFLQWTKFDFFTVYPISAIPLMIGLIALAYFAYRATRLNSRVLPTRALIAICLLGLVTEFLIRIMVL